jgi:hypothetical protein
MKDVQEQSRPSDAAASMPIFNPELPSDTFRTALRRRWYMKSIGGPQQSMPNCGHVPYDTATMSLI